MLTEEQLELYRNNIEVKTNTTKIYRPKRLYKRPDLQRLANRWYGMVYRGEVEVDIRAYPRENFVTVYKHTPVHVSQVTDWDSPIGQSNIEVKRYKLPVMGYAFKCQEVNFPEMFHRAMTKFWKDIKVMATIEEI